jgi:hypothetical protein
MNAMLEAMMVVARIQACALFAQGAAGGPAAGFSLQGSATGVEVISA